MENNQQQFQDDQDLVHVGEEEHDEGGMDAIRLDPADIDVQQRDLSDQSDDQQNSLISSLHDAGQNRGQRKLVPIAAGQKHNAGNDESDVQDEKASAQMNKNADGTTSGQEAQVAQLNDYLENEAMNVGAGDQNGDSRKSLTKSALKTPFQTISHDYGKAKDRYNQTQQDVARIKISKREQNSKMSGARVGGSRDGRKSPGGRASQVPSRQSKGTRIFNYNEDDALNQSYVERVVKFGQHQDKFNQMKEQENEQGKDALEAGRTSVFRKSKEGNSINTSTLQTPGSSHLRHQSIDFLCDVKDRARAKGRNLQQFGTISGDPRESLDQSKTSGITFPYNSPLIEEVRNNNYGKVHRMMGHFIVGKNNSSTVSGLVSQQRNRYLRNSFQPGQDIKLRSKIHRSSTKFTSAMNSDHPGAVGPKTKIDVPKELVLYQISKNMDGLALEHNYPSVSQSLNLKSFGQKSMPGYMHAKSNNAADKINRSFLDFVKAPINRSPLNIGGQESELQQYHNSIKKQQDRSPNQTEHPSVMLDPAQHSVFDTNQESLIPEAYESGRSGISDRRKDAIRQSSDWMPSYLAQVEKDAVSHSPALKNFHITDLLERSILIGSQEREQSKLRQIIEFYKRSVKGDKEMNQRKEIMIRNYRLHLVRDPEEEGIDDDLRSLFTLNKGTSIYVSNSILKPEIHKFGTHVSDHLTKVYAFLKDEPRQQNRFQSLPDYDRFELPPEIARRASQGLPNASGPSSHRRGGSTRYSQNQIETTMQSEVHGARQDQSEFSQYTSLHNQGHQNLPENQGPKEFAVVDSTQQLEALIEEDQKSQATGEYEQTTRNRGQRSQIQSRQNASASGSIPGTQGAVDVTSIRDGLSSRPFTANDLAELEAIAQTNRIFDRWLRNIMSKQSSIHPDAPVRPRLKNGLEAAPRVKDINWHINIANKNIIKEKPMPLEGFTVKSFYETAPYRHLKMLVINQDIRAWFSKFVLKSTNEKSFAEIQNVAIQQMNYLDCKTATDFARHHLTHLDPVMFQDDKLPIELFIDYEDWIQPLVSDIKEGQYENELNDNYEGIDGKTDYYFKDGSRKSISVKVSDFDYQTMRFLVENRAQNISTWRTRLYVRLQDDSREVLNAQKFEAFAWREKSLDYLRIHRLINDELLKRYGYIALTNEILENIQRHIHINLLEYNPDIVRKIILQIEGLFVFAILKATLYSQRNDPFIKALLRKYKIPLDSPALTYFKPQHKEKSHLSGIETFNMKGMKVELDRNSILLMDEKYIKMPIYLNKLSNETIGKYKLFSQPFDVEILHANQSRDFKKVRKADLHQLVNTFPLQHIKFVQAQKVMSNYFHYMARWKWVEQISQKIIGYVSDDFDFDIGKVLTHDQIDPCLMRLLHQLKLYMQTVLFEHFETALRDYAVFLLSFILRDSEILKTKVMEEMKMNPYVRLGQRSSSSSQNSGAANDAELITLQKKPMIQIHALIDDVKVAHKIAKKQKVVTTPPLEVVSKDLFSVIGGMHSSLQDVDRIDGIVFPLMKLETPFLQVPDVKNNERLSHYVRLIEKLIDQALKSTKKELQNLSQLMNIFEKQPDQAILDLKRRSFQLQQEISMAEVDDESMKDERSNELTGQGGAGTHRSCENDRKSKKQGEDEDEESYCSGSDTDDDIGDDDVYQGNQMAYKSVEIDDGLMREELAQLRALYWKILERVQNQYDFGMVHLDCTKFKERILKHCRQLIEHLESHIRSDFCHKMKNIRLDIVGVEGKLAMDVDTIDEVIQLLDYIDSLRNQDNKIGDIIQLIDQLAKRMLYIETVRVKFPDAQFVDYLDIRMWPKAFKKYVEVRNEALLSQKDDLYKQMSRQIDEIFVRIEGFKGTMRNVLGQGLVENDPSMGRQETSSARAPPAAPAATESRASGSRFDKIGQTFDRFQDDLSSGDDQDAPKNDEKQSPRKGRDPEAPCKTFQWLAQEIGMESMAFSRATVESVFRDIQELKQNFDEVDTETSLINKREKLLGVKKTEFKELKTIQDDLKPLFELWIVAQKFGRVFPQWLEGGFSNLDAQAVDIKIEEWLNELRRLQKTSLVTENHKQQELQKFMIDSLNHFKKYGTMMRTLRTPGLRPRHWQQLARRLDLNPPIEPDSVTLLRLILLRLYEEDRLRHIKLVCDDATKEHAVEQALEDIHKDMTGVEFECEYAKDGVTTVVRNLPEHVAKFDELSLRISVLKTNPKVSYVREKISDIDKTIKSVVELIREWADFQRNFVYLNSIFVLEEIQKALEKETKTFLQVQGLYTNTTQGFRAAPAVWRITTRENFLSILTRSNQDCDGIGHGLRAFLERKRTAFPRLYFLSNEDLIHIFGKGSELVNCMISGESMGFISNLFEGIEQLVFSDREQDVTHMISRDGERVATVRAVMTRPSIAVDVWLRRFEADMKQTVQDHLFHAFRRQGEQDLDEWVESRPGQGTYLASQVWFTLKVQSIFEGHRERERARRAAGGEDGERQSQDEVQSAYGGEDPESDGGSEAHEGENHASGYNQSFRAGGGTPSDDEEEDPEDERNYLEDLARQIAKDEQCNPARAMLEKVLRMRERFRVNRNRSPGKQMDAVYNDILATIIRFTGMVKRRLQGSVRQATVALLTCHVYFRDILANLTKDRVYSKDDFKWQIQFKYDIRGLQDVFTNASKDGMETSKALETHKIGVDLEVFGQHRSYGFEYLGNCPRLVVTPLTERCQRSLLVALQYHYGGAPEGPFGTGKTETTKDLSRQLGKLCFVMNCSAEYEYQGVCRFFKGVASSGAWVCFDEFNRMDTRVLSMISQVIITLQNAVKNHETYVQLEDSKILLRNECAVFITLNPGYAGRSDLPMNLKALFRSISMVVPDSIFITEILLYSAGFVGAQQLAKKVVSVQTLANTAMRKSGISHDFGLRSIKSIVMIAETLKLQAQNIIESDLTEIIDEKSMGKIPVKPDQIIKDLMQKTTAKINNAVKQQKNQLEYNSKAKRGTKRQPKSSAYSKYDGDEGQADFEGGKGGLFEFENTQDTADDPNESGDELNMKHRGGYLYQKLWNRAKYTDRQTHAVYRQVGLDVTEHYDEDELEEYIILKAVRDYNHSKFAADDHVIIEGVIKDVFQNAVPDLDAPNVDYGNLREAIEQSCDFHKLDPSKTLKLRAQQFYELTNSKHGCIVVGEPQSGKTALINLLKTALDKGAMNEYMLTVQDRRRAQLINISGEYQSSVVDQQVQKTKQQFQDASISNQLMGGAAKAKARKNDREAQNKKMQSQFQELFKRTKLPEEELEEIRANLRIKGVTMARMNPKGMGQDELFGAFDPLSHDWCEGLFTQEFRKYAAMKDTKRKWILLDGPIDYIWVENLNSILDDNRKMSLPNGDQIKMAEGMCVLLETDNLKNVTPATVSRCGLVYLHRKETCTPKAIFNQWLRNLPPNLQEYQKEIECIANFFMVEAIAVYEAEKKAQKLNFKKTDLHWLTQNFIRLLTSLIHDYYTEYEKSNALGIATTAAPEFGRSLHKLNLGNEWADSRHDPNATVHPLSEAPGSKPGSRETSLSTPQHKLDRSAETPDARTRELEKTARLSKCNFIDAEVRYENALKYTAIWLEAFIIFSIVWTIYPTLSDSGKKELDARLQAKYEMARSDFGTYQREKKKKHQEKQNEKKANMTKLMKGAATQQKSKLTATVLQTHAKFKKDAEPEVDPLTATWTDEHHDKPMLISNYPPNKSFQDYFFCLDSSEWTKFTLETGINEARARYDKSLPSQRKVGNFIIPTSDMIRYSYVLECLVTNQVSTLLTGPNCCGKSTLIRQLLFHGVFEFDKKVMCEHMTMSSKCDAKDFRETIEGMLQWRTNKRLGEKRLRPPENHKLICYVEDVHLAQMDDYGDMQAIEALRDYFTEQAWLSYRKRRVRKIEQVSFFACMASNAPQTTKVSDRALHRFYLLTQAALTTETMRNVFQYLGETMVHGDYWPSAVQKYAKSIVNTMIDISKRVFNHLKPTPTKAHYTFSWRDAFKIFLSTQVVEANSLKAQENVIKLIYHECLRTYADRLLINHDREWFFKNLQEVCLQHFNAIKVDGDVLPASTTGIRRPTRDAEVTPDDKCIWPINDPEKLFLSQWNQEAEGFYMEVDRVDDIQKVIEGNLERFGESNDRGRLGLMLFNQLNIQMLKMLRIISSPRGHLLNVAMKGLGMNSIIKLVTFAANHQLKELEMHEGFSDDEWNNALKACLLYCGNEAKPLTFYIDEYKLLHDRWYEDLECILRNNISTDITRRVDVFSILCHIQGHVEQEKKGMRIGGSASDFRKEDKGQNAGQSARAGQEDGSEDGDLGARRFLERWPHIQANLHQVFLNRVSANFHLVLQYSPSGTRFREKINKHKDLMYLTQMLFMRDLPAAELEQLGQGFMQRQQKKEQDKLRGEGVRTPDLDRPADAAEKECQSKVIKSIVKLYLQSQEAAQKYSQEHNQSIQFTPAHFLRMFECYKRLHRERQKDVKEISQRYQLGLDKIKQAQDTIYNYHQELERKSPILQSTLRSLITIINEIEDEFAQVKCQRDQLKREEYEAENHTTQALRIKDQCEDALNKIIPALNESMSTIQKLTKRDLVELRSLIKPPKVIKLILKILCMLLRVPPVEKLSKKTGRMKPSYWRAATGKDVLGNTKLPQMLVEFDRNKVTPEIMMEVEKVLEHPEYSFEKAYQASAAATGIFKWVKATRDYFYIFQEIEPRRDAFMLSQKQYMNKHNELIEKSSKISQLGTALAGLKEHQQTKDEIIEELKNEIQECSLRKKRADDLLKGLSSEKQKWVVCMRMLSSKNNTVVGDVILSSGFITLLSGFPEKYRNRCIHKWTKILNDMGFQRSTEFSLTELFGKSDRIRRWHVNHLPQDPMSIDNALVIEKTKRFCLLIDPQMQGITWLKTEIEGTDNLLVLKQHESRFQQALELAVDNGRTVIVEQVGDKINMNLLSLMKKTITKGQTKMINFCRKQVRYNKEFKLYVVSHHARPSFDVNVTNHITLVNFCMSLDNLQAQMMSAIVMNERADLENARRENSKEAFDSIKQLKDIERVILSQLDTEGTDLLGDENLIAALRESKNTAEYVASKLKNISVTNQFIQKQREVYAPVAYRASILYFIVQDLQKINHMYQFSLHWFQTLFEKALEKTNAPSHQSSSRSPRGGGDSSRRAGPGPPHNFLDDRIDLLIKTMTQELFQKIQMAIFDKDRRLMTCMLSMRIMQAENIMDGDLYDFLIKGPRKRDENSKLPNELADSNMSWMNKMMWADLEQLSLLKPFSREGLLGHIVQNQEEWTDFYYLREEPITFEDLPNRDFIDINPFIYVDGANINGEDIDDQLNESKSANQEASRAALSNAENIAIEEQDSQGSDIGPHTRGGTSLKRSESEILNDPEIWMVTESERDDSSSDGKASPPRRRDKRKAHNLRQDHQEEEARTVEGAQTQEQEMAKYLIEVQPAITKMASTSNTFDLNRRAKQILITKREGAIKALCELCILRCIRPDHLLEGLDRFARSVLDPDCAHSSKDFSRKRASGAGVSGTGGKASPGGQAQNPAAGSVISGTTGIRNKSNWRQNDNSQESEVNPAQAVASQQNVLSGAATSNASAAVMTPPQSMKSKNVDSQGQSVKVQDQLSKTAESDKSKKKGGVRNIGSLIAEAYGDSDALSPITFLIGHSVNMADFVTAYHQKTQPAQSPNSAALDKRTIAKGLEEHVAKAIEKAALDGDWVFLDNLHLAVEWLPELEDIMARWRNAPDHSPRFRLWITCLPVEGFPSYILQRSIKIAIQPPSTIKQAADVMLAHQAKEAYFRKSGKNSNFHKNMFFGLVYFHAILQGRKKYGTIGWNVPYQFDFSDFEVSSAQLSLLMKQQRNPSRKAILEMLRYFYAFINYAGKMQRAEDQVTLVAILGDLINEPFSLAKTLPADYGSSHFGLPPDGSQDFFHYLDQAIPEEDPYKVFGFNRTIADHLNESLAYSLFSQLQEFNQYGQAQGNSETVFVSQFSDYQTQAIRVGLKSSDDLREKVEQLLGSQTSMLSQFICLQKVLSVSSFEDISAVTGQRYDLVNDGSIIEEMDQNDKTVLKLTKDLVDQIEKKMPFDAIEKHFPVSYLHPMHSSIHKEANAFKILLQVMGKTIRDLIANFEGRHPTPNAVERVWNQIRRNRLPSEWLAVSFRTAHKCLSTFLIELEMKLEFWNEISKRHSLRKVPSWWLPAFFHPRTFLNALAQDQSRNQKVPIGELTNEYDVRPFMTADKPTEYRHQLYFHGLWLEGAGWDISSQLITEATHDERFVMFPVIMLSTKRRAPQPQNPTETSRSDSRLGQISTREEVHRSSIHSPGKQPALSSPLRRRGGSALLTYSFRCPIFKSTMRLATREHQDEEGKPAKEHTHHQQDDSAVEHISLNSMEPPSKWVKRGAALLLERDYD